MYNGVLLIFLFKTHINKTYSKTCMTKQDFWSLVKDYLLVKFRVIFFILALFGWLLLTIYLFGHFFVDYLQRLEEILRSTGFKWGLRLFILLLVIFFVKYKNKLKLFLSIKKFRIAYFIIFLGGVLGWLWFFITLVL